MTLDEQSYKKWEDDGIGQRISAWINTYPDFPDDLYKGIVTYEYLPTDRKAMTLSTVQGEYISQPDILGGYQARYRFKLIYRVKPGDSNFIRVTADSLLDDIGKWSMNQKPDLGDGFVVDKIYPTTLSSKFSAYNNGDEDHQIFFMVEYSVPAKL